MTELERAARLTPSQARENIRAAFRGLGGAWADEEAERALAALAEADNRWRLAAHRVGEYIASTGPEGYYDMTPEAWAEWATGKVRALAGKGGDDGTR